LLTQSVYNLGFDILDFISRIIKMFYISFKKLSVQITIKTFRQLNFVTVTSYLNNLCVILLFPTFVLKMTKKLTETYTE